MKISLPRPDGTVERHEMLPAREWPLRGDLPRSRVAYAAAHVVADPLGDPAAPSPALDWDATLRFRRHLWSHGLRVADGMDTAQRGTGLDWAATRELARRTAGAAIDFGDPAELVVVGAGTDHVSAATELGEIVRAYTGQLEEIRMAGAGVVLMGSRELARIARAPEDYQEVYAQVLAQADRPVILHWLGEMFDPQLAGYWGSRDIWQATQSLLTIIRENSGKVDGVKLSLLDASHETALRAALPPGVRLYTGDDFNFAELIAGDEHGFSDALLGVFDPLAAPAALALRALDEGDVAGFRAVLDPLVPLARHIFAPPTQYYKTGVVFLAWLSGYQDHFVMVGGQQTGRDAPHLAELFRLAAEAGLFSDAALATERMRRFLDG